MSGPQTVAGTRIGISAQRPLTFGRGGYIALDYATIGEVVDGGTHGRGYNEVTHQAIRSRGVQKFKGSFNEGTKTLQLAIDAADAGQILARQALESDSPYAFVVEYQDGSLDYFQALVLGFSKTTAGVDSMVSGSISLSIATSRAGEGIVSVAPGEPLEPQALFARGEQGAAFDPSDLSTMFQDAAGAVPAAVGQPVGLIRDIRLGLLRGAELATNGDFANGLTGWWSGSAIQASVVDGQAQITFAGSLAVASSNWFALNGTVAAGNAYEISFDATYVSGTGSLEAGTTLTPNRVITPAENAGKKTRYSFVSNAATASTAGAVSFGCTASATIWRIDNVSVRPVLGNHAYQTVATARPLLQKDEQGHYYLDFDGVDDFLRTGNIDMTSTSRVTTWAGFYKAADITSGCVLEFSASIGTNPNAFAMYAPTTAGPLPNVQWVSRGTGGAVAALISVESPVKLVASGVGDISAPKSAMRLNAGALSKASTSTQGDGNYGSYPLYIGRRGGSSNPFLGRIYSLVARGTASNDSQIAAVEHWANSKTGAY